MFYLARNLKFRPFSLLVSVLSFLVLNLPASNARTVTVECQEDSISNVLKNLDPQASNTIRVIGTCQEYVGINDFADLTIVGVPSGGKSATIQNLNGSPILWIVASQDVPGVQRLPVQRQYHPELNRQWGKHR